MKIRYALALAIIAFAATLYLLALTSGDARLSHDSPPCAVCGGKGWLVCPTCSGSGEVTGFYSQREPCQHCYSTGWRDCPACGSDR